MRAYFQLVLRYRGLVLALIVLASGAGLWGLRSAVISSSLGKLFLANSPAYEKYLDRIREFGSDEQLIIAFEEEDVLSADALRRLHSVTGRIAGIPQVATVRSILDNREVFRKTGKEGVEEVIEELASSPEKTEKARSKFLDDRFAAGIMLSADSHHGAVLITMPVEGSDSMEDTISLVDEILGIFAQQGYSPQRLHQAGGIAIVAEMMEQTHFNLERLFPMVCGLLILTVFSLFRKIWPVVISTGVAIIAVVWTMAIAVAIDPQLSIMMAAIPAVILIISFSDVIHLCSAYLLEMRETGDTTEAILRSAEDVGTACIYTSLTTFVGFLSLALVPTPIFRQLGILLGLGVGIALLLAMTLVPILLSLLRPRADWTGGIASVSQDIIDRFLSLTRRISLSKPRWVVAIFAVLIIFCTWGITRINVEVDILARLGENNPVRRDAAYFLKHFSGTNVLDLYIHCDEKGGLFEPAVLASIAELEKKLQELEEVDSAISLATIIGKTHRQLPAILTGGGSLPSTRSAIEEHIRQLEAIEPEGLAFLLGRERKKMRVLVRLRIEGLRETYKAGEKVSKLAEGTLPPTIEVEPTGLAYLIGGWLDRILLAQKKGVGISFIVISMLMIFAFRSLRIGLWSMVPNILPLLALGGYVGFAWETTDSDTFMVAMLAIGIGVDDTIHFLTRYRLELERDDDEEKALTRTYHYAGRGIVMTTLILTIGFSPFILSQYFSLNILGTLLPMVLIVALLADLLLLPALARLRLLRWSRAGRSGVRSLYRRQRGGHNESG